MYTPHFCSAFITSICLLSGASAAIGQSSKGLLKQENIVLGRPTATSIAVSVATSEEGNIKVFYGESPGKYNDTTPSYLSSGENPVVVSIEDLQPDKRYYYRVQYGFGEGSPILTGDEHSFQTQRGKGKAFSFGVQGDSHPERTSSMFHPDLYKRTMDQVEDHRPDFYIMLGDDFSIERLIDRQAVNQKSVDAIYQNQRREYISRMSHSTSLFLVNGNHEQAFAATLATGLQHIPLCAANGRNKIFPLPSPNGFYTGDLKVVEGIEGDGLLRDYYAWEWGDALFVTLDPYWHSPVPVDGGLGEDTTRPDPWDVTIGNEQYQWLKQTLEGSHARFKFVFSHHMNGTGRGAVIMAHSHEWGGYDRNGENWEFDQHRPGWKLPIHQLMVKNGVTIFFQGHDHIYSREILDGVVYQSVPNPADDHYQPVNCTSYNPDGVTFPGASYDPEYGVIFPNSGYLHVTVSPDKVKVDYFCSYLPNDEKPGHLNGEVAYSYTLPPEPGEKGIDFVCPPSKKVRGERRRQR
jgi:hypothetical protein